MLLFLDTGEINQSRRRATGPFRRIILLGVPLFLVVTAVAAAWVLPHERRAFCLVLARVIASTDMAPAERTASDHRIPLCLHNLLKTESGYNDGVVAPIFLFAIEYLRHTDGAGADEALADMVPEGVSPPSSVVSSSAR